MKLFPKSKGEKYRFLFLLSIALGMIIYFVVLPVLSYIRYQPKDGDIIFQSLPVSDLTKAIEGATESPYSHTGLVFKKNGFWYVREAIGPVTDTVLYLWIIRGRGAKFSVFRLKEAYKEIIPSFIKESQKYLGLPYDINYEFDDEKIYCSELIYKSFYDATQEKMGVLVKLKELKWESHRSFIESIEASGVPLEREMITPKDLSRATQLQKVFSNGI